MPLTPAQQIAAAKAAADALDKEYYFYETVISGFNGDCLEIKKWSVTAASAVAVAGQVAGTPAAVQVTIIAGLALAFWVTETLWRINQWAFIRRVQELEHGNPTGPQISHKWTRYYFGAAGYAARFPAAPAKQRWESDEGEASLGGQWQHFWSARTALPHALVIVIALIALGVLHISTPAQQDDPVKQQLSGEVRVRIVPDAGGAPPKPLGSP